MYKKFDQVTLEREYSPSSCIDDITLYIDQYIEQSKAATALAAKNNSLLNDLKYGACPDEVLDLYLPTQGNTKKLQVYIHGGYWQELTKAESSFAANNFQQHGCYFAVLNYSLAPNASLTEIVDQNRRALAWLYASAEKYGFDANEIYLSGSSAGAHLAMMMLNTHWSTFLPDNHLDKEAEIGLIKGICAVSGIYDLRPIPFTSINDALQLGAGEAELNSPLLLEVGQQCPVIFAFGDNETDEFKRQTRLMVEKLVQLEVATQQKEITGRNHFDVVLDLANPNSWLSRQVFQQMGI
jgi:arylformamidase